MFSLLYSGTRGLYVCLNLHLVAYFFVCAAKALAGLGECAGLSGLSLFANIR